MKPIYQREPLFKVNLDVLSINHNAIPILEMFEDELDMDILAQNPYAIHIIKRNLHKLSFSGWYCLSTNRNAISILRENIDKIHPHGISKNKNGIEILKEYPHLIDWDIFSKHPDAIPFLKENMDKINWSHLNINPNGIEMLEQNPDHLKWNYISSNINALPLLEKYPLYRNWKLLSMNENAIPLLLKTPNKIYWRYFSANPNAPLSLIKQNLDKINWSYACTNPNLISIIEENWDKIEEIDKKLFLAINENAIHLFYKLNYEVMKKRNFQLKFELIQYVCHPDRILNIIKNYNISFKEYLIDILKNEEI